MRGRGQAALVASPVLVGAVTVLIACISVLLAVQANQGLPFVPTYDVKAQIPGGSNLVVGNEVRIFTARAQQAALGAESFKEYALRTADSVLTVRAFKSLMVWTGSWANTS